MSQADKGFSAAWFVICIAHNISFYSQYHLLFCFICHPGGATPSVMHFFSSHHTAASNTAYIIPSYSFSYSLSQAGKKPPDISLTHADLIFLSHIPTISIQVKLLPYIFCLSLPCDLLILHYSLRGYYGKLKCCIHPHRLYSKF